MLESMINRRVVLAGGPSTGKTSVLNKLKKLGFKCYDESAREILSEYEKKGSSFRLNPIKVSEEILKKRDKDFTEARDILCKNNIVFFDRGIHEITAYLRSINSSEEYWEELLKNYDYDMVFFFPSWKDIYIKDKNRVEEYEEATRISPYIDKVYEESSILKIKVPCTSINERVDFILNNI
jgi:predicted ATPase|tara:strand:+ start:432 stop:974 length:543 start_codon:yes stop_codon:yes gene_type:complete